MTDPGNPVRDHYERHPYPVYPLWLRPRRCDTYAWNLDAACASLRGARPPRPGRILVAGCGTFAALPAAVANPDTEIVALDLSERSLARARLHCALHLRRHVTFACGDLLDPSAAPGPFDLIDAYGVLHHLPDFSAGLRALRARLSPAGILRLMVYHRDARRLEESARRAFRIAGVRTLAHAKRMLARARDDSPLSRLKERSFDLRTDAGIADALLHPLARVFTVRELAEELSAAGLAPLRYVHPGALPDPAAETARAEALEHAREFDDNLAVYAGRTDAGRAEDRAASPERLVLNPCLEPAVSRLRLLPVRIPPRIGIANPPLGFRERAFLRRFRGTGIPVAELSAAERERARAFEERWFLIPG